MLALVAACARFSILVGADVVGEADACPVGQGRVASLELDWELASIVPGALLAIRICFQDCLVFQLLLPCPDCCFQLLLDGGFGFEGLPALGASGTGSM